MQRTTAIPDLRGLLLVALVSAWLAGILLDQVLLLPSYGLLAGAGAALVLVVVCWHHARVRLIALVLLRLLPGVGRVLANFPAVGACFTTRANPGIALGKLQSKNTAIDGAQEGHTVHFVYECAK